MMWLKESSAREGPVVSLWQMIHQKMKSFTILDFVSGWD